MGKVIILNGIGSVGKSSTARALQGMLSQAYLHVQGDAFLEMIAPWLYGHHNGISFTNKGTPQEPRVEITMGPELDRLMDGMRRSVAALSDAGNRCIVDDVMLSARDQELYQTLLGDRVTFVGLHAPLEVLEQRERERGDRLLGLARWQFGRVHRGITYDLECSTHDAAPEQVAATIADKMELTLR